MANGNGGNGDETGSKDRATVALVAAELREVKAIIEGHAKETAANLGGINRNLAPLASIPERVARLEVEVRTIQQHDVAEKDAEKEKSTWWRGVLITVAVFAFGAFINLAIAYHWFG